MKTYILLFFVFCSISCSKQKKINKEILTKNKEMKISEVSNSSTNTYLDKYNNKNKVLELTNLSLKKGDTISYKELWAIYHCSGHNNEFLPIAITMANKYKYAQAYFDVYTNLERINHFINHSKNEDSLNDLDLETRVLAYSYLTKAASIGHLIAKQRLLLFDNKGLLIK